MGALKVKAAAAYLTNRGYPCSPGTVRNLVKADKLRCYRPGATGKGPMVFLIERLDAFLASAEVGGPASKPVGRAVKAPRPARPTIPSIDRRAALKAELGS